MASSSFSIHCMEYKRNIVLGEKMFQRISMATLETYLSECSAIHHDHLPQSYHNRKSQSRLKGGHSNRILGIPGCIQQAAGFKLPPPQPWNCAIELLSGTPMPKEQKAMEERREDILNTLNTLLLPLLLQVSFSWQERMVACGLV